MANNSSQNHKNKPKGRFKRLFKKQLFWYSAIIAVSAIGATTYYIYNGGSVGIDHNLANKSYKQSKINQSNQFKKHHTDNYPTIEEVQSKLKERFHTNDLTKPSLNQIKSAVNDIWGSKAANIILSGQALSNSMTPSDADQAEVNIAKSDNSNKQYVGFSTANTSTSIYQKGYETSVNQVNFGPMFAYSNQVTWKNINNYNISQPFILTTQSNSIAGDNKVTANNTKMFTLMLLVQYNSLNPTTWQDVKDQVQDMNIKVNNKTVKLAGSTSETQNSSQGIYGKGNGLQLARMSNSDFSKSNKIFPNSIIPICFDVPMPDSDSASVSYTVSIKDMGIYTLKFNQDGNIKLS